MRRLIYALVALSSITSHSAFGSPVRVDFAGSISSITGYDASGAQISEAEAEAALGGSIGTHFSGYVVYENSTVESDGYGEALGNSPGQPPYPSWALYYTIGQSYSTIGNFVTSGGVVTDVYDNETYLQNAYPSEVVFEGVGFLLYANGAGPGEPLHSTSLVGIPWSIENFPNTTIRWSLYDSVDHLNLYPIGTVTALVPEPEALGLFALAGCTLLATRRERAREESNLRPRD